MNRTKLQQTNHEDNLISLIVTCHNLEEYIGRCLDSLIAQSYHNLEIIVIDDGSTDNSPAICDAYAQRDSRIKVIHQANAGAGQARNTGIDMATGQYIAFVDGDDVCTSDMYQYMMSAALQTGADVTVCGYMPLSEYRNRNKTCGHITSNVNPDSTDDQSDSKVMADPNVENVHVEKHTNCGYPSIPSTSNVEKTSTQDISNAEKTSVQDTSVNLVEMTRDEALFLLVSEDEKITIRNAPWNKLVKRETLGNARFPKRRYEDISFSADLMCRAGAAGVAYVDMPLYLYMDDRKTSATNTNPFRYIISDQLPGYLEKDEILKAAGRADLAACHDYMVYKKFLLLYTDARRVRSKDDITRKFIADITREIRTLASRKEEIYNCRIADKHTTMRMKLFLAGPLFYNVFMDLNENIVLPLRRKLRG